MNTKGENSRREGMTVGLFGYYDANNWGDDLMACLFAKIIADAGGESVVFKRAPGNPYYEGLRTTETADSLVSEADFLVYGGGGILATGRKDGSRFAENILEIIHLAKTASKPIYLVSVGGDGRDWRELPHFVQQLIKAAEGITVRNKEDLATVFPLNSSCEFYHDVVWSLPKFIEIKNIKKYPLKLAIDVVGSINIFFSKFYQFLFFLLNFFRKDIQFVFIYSNVIQKDSGNSKNFIKLNSLENDFNVIGGIDLVISTKLHLGLACQSYGKIFISLFAKKKTKLMFANTGMESQCLNWWQSLIFPLKFLKQNFPYEVEGPLESDLESIRQSSLGHVTFVQQKIMDQKQETTSAFSI